MFKVGDKVVCIISGGTDGELVEGKEYTIMTITSIFEKECVYIMGKRHKFFSSRFKLKEKDMFTLEDIKEGYLVEDVHGYIWVVSKKKDDTLVLVNEYDFALLTKGVFGEISRVYDLSTHYSGGLFNCNNRELLWERKEIKEMTVAEIEKELGYSIKVVK